MCAGGYVMPSVSDPGYFCTNGMSESRHDSPFANSGLVVTIEPGETGSSHPLAGVHYQQRVERLAYLAAGRSYEAPLQWARDFLAGPDEPGQDPDELSPRRAGDRPGSLPARARRGSPRERTAEMDRRFGGRFLRDATLTGPESRGSSPVRIIREPESRAEPGRRRPLPLRRRGRLRRRNHQRGRRRPADGAGDRRQVRELAMNPDEKTPFDFGASFGCGDAQECAEQ